MANPHRGEVAVETNGASYTLRFSTNAICELEDHMGEPINVIAARLGNAEQVGLKMARALFWAALRDNHREVTLPQAGELIDALGAGAAMEKVGEAFRAAFPPANEQDARPPKPAGRKGNAG